MFLDCEWTVFTFLLSGAPTKEEDTHKEEGPPCKEEYTLYEYEQIIILSPIIVRGFQRLGVGTVKIIAFVFVYRVKYNTNIAKRS